MLLQRGASVEGSPEEEQLSLLMNQYAQVSNLVIILLLSPTSSLTQTLILTLALNLTLTLIVTQTLTLAQILAQTPCPNLADHPTRPAPRKIEVVRSRALIARAGHQSTCIL